MGKGPVEAPLAATEIVAPGIAVLTLDRPATRNALSLAMVQAIRAEIDLLASDGSVRALVLTGANNVFVSGADVSELLDRKRDDAFRRINTGLFRAVEALPFPTIAAIEAYALGGGLELAMACDLRVAGQGAIFGQPEVALGIIPGAGGTYRLPRLVGLGMARELIFTGRRVDAAEAQRIGLINRVTADGTARDAAIALAHEIAKNAPLAVRFTKVLLNHGGEMSTDTAMALESTMQAVLFEDGDKRDRMTAFLERKRRKEG